MTRITEKMGEWLGWCPNAGSAGTRRTAVAGGAFSTGSRHRERRGQQGPGGEGIPPGGRYEHTQRGDMMIAVFSVAILLILASVHIAGFVWVTLFVLIVLAGALLVCSTLTVTVGPDALSIRFGPVGLIRKSWPLADVESVVPVTNPWYYGLGIHWTPHGVLYNVSGFRAVEVRFFSGTTIRIGSDEPEELCTAIRRAAGV